jgi:hypothetical protein
MVFVCGVIVRAEVDEHVIIIDWEFSDERGRMTVLHFRIEQTWERCEMTKQSCLTTIEPVSVKIMYEFLIV